MTVRNAAVHHTGKDGSSLYLFYINVEHLYLILNFINENSFALIVKGFNINRLRIKLSIKLIKQFIHIKDFNKAIFCLELALKNIFKVFLINILWFPIKFISVLYGKYSALKYKIIKAKE